ncbi:bifunctional 4-hydroxy-2-oxoglutarate aldolase/2-dehydro-3-deoxy-phosphogluconate aldolase [Desemzia sp. FAM 23989]|uniref:bifunctional 4-hydroxy-2-oxoglutarate aldolase/2-dehydro-3-deoxy-phosphogluconate aldolase n=1 Tax=Desemzia sp. FAM 23989 TaxID=3259523 RepID=UPI0038853470
MNKKTFPKVTIIMRGYNYQQVNLIMETLEGKEEQFAIEITLNSPDVFETLQKIIKQYGEKFWIGAGTVLNLQNAKDAVEAGAQFILSPVMLSKEVLDYCKQKNVMSVPAGMTPTEVYTLFQNGADVVKLFPATSLDRGHFKAMQGPLGELSLMAVGGINAGNANDFLNKGASYVGIGSGIFEKEDVLNNDKEAVKKSLAVFEETVFGTTKEVAR